MDSPFPVTHPAQFQIPPTSHLDLRLGHLVENLAGKLAELPQVSGKGRVFAILGAPDERGILAGGGRAGAAKGPDRIRQFLYSMTPPYTLSPDSFSKGTIVDCGNLTLEETVQDTHEKLAQAVFWLRQKGVIPLVLGGGHDLAYGELLGHGRAAKGPMAVLNLDAHMDVRPLREGIITSGTPFRRVLENKDCQVQAKDYWVLGLQPQQNAHEQWSWLKKKGGHAISREDCRQGGGSPKILRKILGKLHRRAMPIQFSLDIDGVDAASAPGCSAPQADGIPASELMEMASLLHREKSLTGAGVYEVSPPLDEGDRTSRLAATFLHRLIFG